LYNSALGLHNVLNFFVQFNVHCSSLTDEIIEHFCSHTNECSVVLILF